MTTSRRFIMAIMNSVETLPGWTNPTKVVEAVGFTIAPLRGAWFDGLVSFQALDPFGGGEHVADCVWANLSSHEVTESKPQGLLGFPNEVNTRSA